MFEVTIKYLNKIHPLSVEVKYHVNIERGMSDESLVLIRHHSSARPFGISHVHVKTIDGWLFHVSPDHIPSRHRHDQISPHQ